MVENKEKHARSSGGIIWLNEAGRVVVDARMFAGDMI